MHLLVERFVHMLLLSLRARHQGKGKVPASGFRPERALQLVTPLLNPCIIAACLLLPLFLGEGMRVYVFILRAIALKSLMPSPAVQFIHYRLTKRQMKHSVLMRRCGAYRLVSTQFNRCGREVCGAKSSMNTTAQRYIWQHHGYEKLSMVYWAWN